MTANWQSLLVGGFVVAALIYLLIKFFGKGGGKGTGCGKCSSSS
jgi:hypothetical protein